jgi:hypothetical protein
MLEVIGAGFGRTGTHSLGLALEILGLGPCYTLHDVSRNPKHQEIWNDALDGKPVDWNFLFQSYKSAVEWPSVTFIDKLIQQFPNAKVILTMRDPESWYGSAKNTIFEGLELSAHNPNPIKRENSGMIRRLILEYTFGGQYWDKKYALKVYQEHINHVLGLIPRERLLQLNVNDGWEPLCVFLRKPVPNEPFPKVNQRLDFLNSQPEWVKTNKSKKHKGMH